MSADIGEGRNAAGRALEEAIGRVWPGCRNEALRQELADRGESPERLRVLGWTEDMPGWMTAADVVVDNAGRATGLEAAALAAAAGRRREDDLAELAAMVGW